MISTIEDIEKFINDKSFSKIFLLCGKNSFENSGAKKLFYDSIKNKDIKIYYKISNIPNLNELIEIIKKIKLFKPNLILAIGGGAIIDYAKIANLVDDRQDIADLIKNYSTLLKKYTELAVIPTTAGSGAEVTSNAVMYVDGIKYSIESELLIPNYYFLVPEFLITTPQKVKASSGFDAIAQAVESLVSKKSNLESVEYASKSIKISINVLYILFV